MSITEITVIDWVRRGLEGWKMCRAGRKAYSGERWWVLREMGGLGQGSSLPKTGEEGPSLDTLTWCHFEELIHLLGLCFDHWQLSHLSWGLRKRQVQLISCPWGCPHHAIQPTTLLESGSLLCTIKEMAGHKVLGTAQGEERQVLRFGEAKSDLKERNDD